MRDLFIIIKGFLKHFADLPLIAQVIGVITVAFQPVAIFIIPIILLILLDYHTGIRASQVEKNEKNIVSSKDFRTKLTFIKLVAQGLVAFIIFDYVLVHEKLDYIPFLGISISYALTKLYCFLVILNEIISILENLNRQGGKISDTVQPLLRILKIRKENIISSFEKNKDEKKE